MNLVNAYLDLLSNAATQCPDLTDQMRVAISLKNQILTRIIPIQPTEFSLGLVERLTAESIFSLPGKISTHLALTTGKILNKKTSDEE